jgi:hypothetical protein
MRPTRETPAHRAIALAGWVLAVVGLVGVIVYPRAVLLWVFLIFFGIASIPRAFLEWWRERRRL